MTAQSHFIRAAYPRNLAVRSETRRGRWRSAYSPLLLCAITFFGASMVASAEPPAGAPASEGLGSADGEQSGTRAVVTDLKRAGNTVTLKFIIYNDSTVAFGTGSKLNADGYHGYRNVSGVHLVDSAGKKKYFPVKDSEGNCECSDNIDDVAPKSQMSIWVRFPAPPDGVAKVAVQIPHFIPLDDVPIK
jgi:hypothetical protein